MSGIKLMKNEGAGAGERMIIMNDPSGGHLKLFPGSNQVVIQTQQKASSAERQSYKSTDSGDNYTLMPESFPDLILKNIGVSFNNRYYYIGDPSIINGTYYIAQSNDFGNSWTYDASNSGIGRFGKVNSSRDGRYALGTGGGYNQNGDVLLTQDFGESWTKVISFNAWFNNFVDATGQNMIVGGYGLNTQYSDDYGNNWSNFPEDMTSFGGAMVSGDGNYKVVWEAYLSSVGARVYVSTDWTNWTETKLTDRLYDGAISNDGKYMLIVSSDSYNGPDPYMNVSSDYGATWSQVDTGVGSQYWGFCDMSSDGQYMLAVGGLDGGSFNKCVKSIDYGQTWQEITEMPANRYYGAELSASGRYAYACGYDEGIFHSKDYMATWTQQFDSSNGTGVFINF